MHIHSVEMWRGWMTFMPQRLRDVQMLTTDRQFWCTKCSAHVGFGLCKLLAICLGDVACCWVDKGWLAINSEWATIDASCLVALGSLDLRTCCIQTWPESQWHVVASCLRVAEFAEGNLIDNSQFERQNSIRLCMTTVAHAKCQTNSINFKCCKPPRGQSVSCPNMHEYAAFHVGHQSLIQKLRLSALLKTWRSNKPAVALSDLHLSHREGSTRNSAQLFDRYIFWRFYYCIF